MALNLTELIFVDFSYNHESIVYTTRSKTNDFRLYGSLHNAAGMWFMCYFITLQLHKVYRKTDSLEVDCYVLLFLKNVKRRFNLRHVTKASAHLQDVAKNVFNWGKL